jgi:hypothetical protein
MLRLLNHFKTFVISVAEGIQEFKAYKKGKLK